MIRLDTSDPHAAPGWTLPPTEPTAWLTCSGKRRVTRLTSREGNLITEYPDPLAGLAAMPKFLEWAEHRTGGVARWVGYLGYDVGTLFETLPRQAREDPRLPLYRFGMCLGLPAHRRATWEHAPLTPPENPLPSNLERRDFERAVARAIEYVRAGDVFQVNLSQRLARPTSRTAREIYRRLRDETPATFGALLELGAFSLISNSPELFFRLDADRRITMRPIKGTRPAAPGMAEELLASAKDQAELTMIVDLIRNDVGRVAEVGSVKVTRPRDIETHPTVVHGVATVEAKLRPDVAWLDLLRAIFPCGSITGAPKIRAMQIIDQLEPHRRGAYCGAIGYLAADGTAQFNVAIRTMTLKDGIAHIPVGGGIVADSTPAAEYDETIVKAAALLRALN